MVQSMDELDGWTAVAHHLARRIFDELVWTKAEVVDASGVTIKSLNRYLEGEPITRVDKRRDLGKALWGRPDAIDRIRRGEPPVPASGSAVVTTPEGESTAVQFSPNWQWRQTILLGHFNNTTVHGQDLILGFAEKIASEEPGVLAEVAAYEGTINDETRRAAEAAARDALRKHRRPRPAS